MPEWGRLAKDSLLVAEFADISRSTPGSLLGQVGQEVPPGGHFGHTRHISERHVLQ